MKKDKSTWFRSWHWIVLFFIILFVAVIRLRLINIPLERDEGEFAFMGQLILRGIPPYSEAYNMKMPGIYTAYAILMAAFGQSIAGIHFGLLLVNAASIILVFLLTKKIFDSFTALISGASYAILSLSTSVLGLARHATHFVVLFVLLGTLFMLKALENNDTKKFFLSGMMFGVSFLMKQPGIFFSLFAILYIVIEQRKRIELSGSRITVHCSWLTAGVLLPVLTMFLLLAMMGVFGKFWFWTFQYASTYGSIVTVEESIKVFRHNIQDVVSSDVWLWITAGIGFVSLIINKKKNIFFILTFALFSFLSVCPGFYFRQHYFILLLPALSLFIGIAIQSLKEVLEHFHLPAAQHATPVILFAIVASHSVIEQREIFFTQTAVEVVRSIHGLNPFPESLEIARHLREESTDTDRIAVIGSEPQIYFYANRRSATGYIYTYGLMEPINMHHRCSKR